ncbi:MAG TPA: ABC transporter ATP-binding protein [Acidimicrobiales bacterium]|jgi:iron complex transport system ATP-binding protein|nr:ABC transporter ATP-binding protein [Acidimicrobiales bacterium]
MSAALEATGVTVRVGDRALLDDVGLSVAAGEWVTVIGPNGAGKTTLVHAIAGLRRVDGGQVRLSGRDLGSLSVRSRAGLVAFVPQAPVVPEGMSVADYVLLGRVSHRSLLRAETPHDRSVVGEVLARLDLVGLAARAVQTLSGGERQRAVIARALVQEAPLLVLDEPTTGLDLRHQLEVLEVVAEERRSRRIAVLATLHDLTLAGRFADRICLLDAGRTVASGAVPEVLTETLLRAHYGVDVTVLDVAGTPVVVPNPRAPT